MQLRSALARVFTEEGAQACRAEELAAERCCFGEPVAIDHQFVAWRELQIGFLEHRLFQHSHRHAGAAELPHGSVATHKKGRTMASVGVGEMAGVIQRAVEQGRVFLAAGAVEQKGVLMPKETVDIGGFGGCHQECPLQETREQG